MSRRPLKSQASSSRAATGAFGAGFGTSSRSAFGATSSPLSYVTEPPDLSSISDPNVVVHFKNLSKRDSTTKAKALEEIQAYISSSQDPVEEGIVEAWIKIFPRTSIDNSRRVRQLTYTLHGSIATSAGKRIAKYMPKAVGAWICGLFDNDRGVVKAAHDALLQVFPSPEKIQNVRRAYQQSILEYCREAINGETVQTLSDERTVSPDDAQAKYARVISACVAAIGSLFTELNPEDLTKHESDYQLLLADENVWTFASHGDVAVRRSLHRFLRTSLSKQRDAVSNDLDSITKAYLANGLNSDQTGSTYDYIEALQQLTSAYPTVWTDHYKSKTAVNRRLRQFLKKGSQSGPREYWENVAKVFKVIPREVLPASAADAVDLLAAMHGGIISKEEPRMNLGAAFGAYLDVAAVVCLTLSHEDQVTVSNETILPIISQYIRPVPEGSQWNVPPPNSAIVAAKAIVAGTMPSILKGEWPRYAERLVEDIKTSAPEQSKDFDKSQKALIQQANRISTLQSQSLRDVAPDSLRPVFSQASMSIITEALTVLRNRNGKPYGAAGAVLELLRLCSDLVKGNDKTKQVLEVFMEQDLAALFVSPSSSQLADILYSFQDSATFETAWRTSLKAVLDAPDSAAKFTALESLLASPKIPSSFNLASSDKELQIYISKEVHSALQGTTDWSSLEHILRYSSRTMSAATTDDVLIDMTQALSISDQTSHALQGLQQITKRNPSFIQSFVPTSEGSSLVQRLLFLSESSDDSISQDALALNNSIQNILSQGSSNLDSKRSMYDVIQRGLKEVSRGSVSVDTLVELAEKIWGSEESKEECIAAILPPEDEWDSSLVPFLEITPRSSLSITNPLGGAIYLVDQSPSRVVFSKKFPRDADGYSAAFRNATYVVKLMGQTDVINFVSVEGRRSLLHRLALTLQLADDNLGLAGSNNLWSEYSPEVEADAISFISEAQRFITEQLKSISAQWTHSSSENQRFPLLTWGIEILQRNTEGTSSSSFYSARAYTTLLTDMIELYRWSSKIAPELETIVRSLRKTQNIFCTVGFLTGFGEPLIATKSCERMCNELVADLTGIDLNKKPDQALQQLVLLNTILYGQEDAGQGIAKQRVVFLVKHILPWLQDETVTLPIKAEVCRVLVAVLPLMADIYGEHWTTILDSLATNWSKTEQLEENEYGQDSPIPFVHASLKLHGTLRGLSQGEDPNDDLLDALNDSEGDLAKGLMNLLKHSQHFPDDFHQPLKIVNELLARQIAKVSPKLLESSEDLFPLLYVESQPVQQTAFNILHKQIPAAQEQISVNAALEKTTVRLPEELLSLILEAPTMHSLAEASFERTMPLPLRGYLLSWLLVFDHLEHASYKVKTEYIDHIKDGDYLPGLLDFMTDFLGHGRGKPADVSKVDVTSYIPDIEPPERDAQWLLTHLYYLCLTHVPSLTRSWYIDLKSRQKVVAVKSWTEKHVSPPVISAALDAVSDWSNNQQTGDDTDPLTIKISPRAREITATYPIDESTLSFRISLPPVYPLEQALVEGISRVAVSDQKWQSWLRISQGAITFSNGSIIEGLAVFKRNVVGALRGQTECAICYSIVGPDKQLPNKRCGTCKNLFHGGCLFRWFKSSNSSSCPLCRNAFNYG